MHSDQSIEQEIQDKGLNAPRVTPADVEANIEREWCFTASQGVYGMAPGIYKFEHSDPESLLTLCVLVLKNGFTITGESACVSPEIFNAEKGREIARAKAVEKIWPLMGYALKEKLHHD